MNSKNFHETISQLLNSRLQPLITEGKSLNLVSCVEIFTTIFDSLVECIKAADIAISNEAVNYLAQQYYDAILINGTQELDPEIFSKRAKLENIETKELAFLTVMLKGTDFSFPVIEEIKKRS